MAFKVLKEEEFYKNQETNSGKSQNESNNKLKEIKGPHNIKFNLIDEISCRRLYNVGATCCMNKYKIYLKKFDFYKNIAEILC